MGQMVLYHSGCRLRLLVCMFALLAGYRCYAQSKNTGQESQACTVDSTGAMGDVSGVVLDPAGASISSAAIRFSCGSKTFESKSGSDGRYSIELPFGNYAVTVFASGFARGQQPRFDVAQKLNSLDFHLSLQQSSSIVNVVAPAGYVASSSTAATKTGTPLVETPQPVSVITLDEMQQRGVQTFEPKRSITRRARALTPTERRRGLIGSISGALMNRHMACFGTIRVGKRAR